jgi:hypothetical protein
MPAASSVAGDGGRQDPAGPGLDAAREFPGGLVGLDRAQPRQGDVVPVYFDPDGAGGELDTGPGTASLEAVEPDSRPGTLTLTGLRPRIQRTGERV